MTWRKREIMDMAREAGIRDCTCSGEFGCLEAFAKLAREDALEQPVVEEPVPPDDESIFDAWVSASDSDGIAYDGPSFERGYKLGQITQPAPVQEPVAWMFEDDEDNGHKTFRQTPPSPEVVAYLAKWNRPEWVPIYTAPSQRKPLWIDPNDKTQTKFLPNIGEPVLFCHNSKTYYGRHTGGSFQCGAGVTKRNFNTWECRWMYLPAAHGIKENT